MRDVNQLHPELQKKIKILKSKCEEAGLKIGIAEALRTVAEQEEKYAIGRTKPGKKVTNARGTSYSSMHQWGVAFDVYRNDGKGAYYDKDGFFTKVGKIGQSIGLEWGGTWTFQDKPHFQLPYWGSTAAKLRNMYGVPEVFFKTWSKNTASKPARKVDRKFIVSAKSGLRLHNKPSLTSKVIAKMPKDAIFMATGEQKGTWLKGTYGKKMGWASSKYLR